MGVLIMHEWARLLAMTSACYAIWACIWGIIYRKYFWDMVGGTLGPNGLIPPPQATFFVAVIVKVPIVQILNIVFGVMVLALELPLPLIEGTSIHRSFIFRVVFYLMCGVIATLVYQSVDAALFYAITSAVYMKAISLGEEMKSAKDNRGMVGMA
ncbi:hypothetical protein T439DRAFT_319673 [Meredithblackwellia eburnea MCA 4105]